MIRIRDSGELVRGSARGDLPVTEGPGSRIHHFLGLKCNRRKRKEGEAGYMRARIVPWRVNVAKDLKVHCGIERERSPVHHRHT